MADELAAPREAPAAGERRIASAKRWAKRSAYMIACGFAILLVNAGCMFALQGQGEIPYWEKAPLIVSIALAFSGFAGYLFLLAGIVIDVVSVARGASRRTPVVSSAPADGRDPGK